MTSMLSPKNKRLVHIPRDIMFRELPISLKMEEFHKRYLIGEKIGSGGFGRVHKAIKLNTRQDVIAKFIQTDKVPAWFCLRGIYVPLEILLLMQCAEIDGVVSFEEVFAFEDHWVIIMPCEPAGSIDMYDYIGEKTYLSEREAANILHQLIGILLQCEKKRVLHRDIKDENIMINRHTGIIKLIDFGSGTFVNHSRQEFEDFDGTRVYCPPEWIRKRKYVGSYAEVWTLGILLYDMICGDVPFTSDTKILIGEYNFKRTIPSEECRQLIAKCLQRDPTQRPTLVEILDHPWMRSHAPCNLNNNSYHAKAELEKYDYSRKMQPWKCQTTSKKFYDENWRPILLDGKESSDSSSSSASSTTSSSSSSHSNLSSELHRPQKDIEYLKSYCNHVRALVDDY